ncbi:hypothetical protein PR048_022928 [Dryococelus australis]|uniref:Uncharacterized protein n=1 Tax=Dryococelus australis TaxID=614101 RepID=A0ABQ9GSP6_9NEOP|nr:hypothetical protein PR048_022928 [Dryococelus australis]
MVIAERYKFHKHDEQPTESMSHDLIQRKLFIESNLNFERACTIAFSMELAASQTKLLQPTTPDTVNSHPVNGTKENDDRRIGHQEHPSGYGRGHGHAKASDKSTVLSLWM